MVNVNIQTRPIYKKAFHLPVETAVYVPSTNKAQKPIKGELMRKRVQEVKKYLGKLYGGYSSMKVTGGYVLKTGDLVQEDVVKVTAFAERKTFEKNKRKIQLKLKSWGKRWGQEAMGYEYEGDLYYV